MVEIYENVKFKIHWASNEKKKKLGHMKENGSPLTVNGEFFLVVLDY